MIFSAYCPTNLFYTNKREYRDYSIKLDTKNSLPSILLSDIRSE